MRRELLLIGEMIEAAEQARALVSGIDLDTLNPIGSGGMRCCGTSPCWARPQPSSMLP
jgi:hypothetical protein